MSKPFDVATKHLIEAHPQDWLALVDVKTAAPVTVVDADLATVTAEADKVLHVADEPPWLLHLELQTSHDKSLVGRLLRYNILLGSRHEMPVRSVAVLLRPAADGKDLAGVWQQHLPGGLVNLTFAYDVVRIWEVPVERILAGGLGTLPLAPIAQVALPEVAGVVQRINERLRNEARGSEAEEIWVATYVLMGLKYRKK